MIVFDIEYLFGTEKIAPFEISRTLCILSKMFDKSVQPSIAVLLDPENDPVMVREILECEIDGVVPRVAWLGIDASIDAYRSLLGKKKHFPKSIVDHFAKTRPKKSSKKNDLQIILTPRQRQVLHLIQDRGSSNKNIARVLRISESTVKLHISAILKKFGAINRTQLALMANRTMDSEIS